MLEAIVHALGGSFERAPWGWALLGLFVVTLVKIRPLMRRLANEREVNVLAVRDADFKALQERVVLLEKKADDASSVAHAAEMKLVYAVSAVQLLAARIRADNPDDTTLAQAMELLSAATGGQLPSWAGKLATGIGQIKGEAA